MARLLLALPLLLGFAQDDATIQELIRRLDDADLEVRDKAVRDLVQVGAKALEALRKAATSDSAEVRTRATQALKAIESDLRAREACPAYKPLALKRTGTVGDVLDELARHSGARFDASADLRAIKASVDASTVLQALDQMCAGSDGLSYSFADDGSYRLSADKHLARPASYFEGFKVSLAETQAIRKCDFKETTVSARFSIQAAWEPQLKALKRVRYEFEPAKDDAGRDVEIVPAGEMAMVGMAGGGIWLAAGFGDEGDPAGPQAFDLKGLAAEAKSLKAIKGTARVSFPLGRVDVTFADPESGANQAVGDITVRLDKVRSNKDQISVKFAKAKGDVSGLKDEVLGRIDPASVRAVDEEGREHVGEIAPATQDPTASVVVMGGPGQEPARAVVFKASFPTLEKKEFKKFSFRMSDAVFEKSVPFEIRDVKLP